MVDPPLIYRKIFESIETRTKNGEMTPKELRIILGTFGMCKEDWFEIGKEMKEFGFFAEVTRYKIIINDGIKDG